MKTTLKTLSNEYISAASVECFANLKSLEQYQRSSAICCYLSMHSEIHTYDFIQEALSEGKRVYIPKVTGPRSENMLIVELDSYEHIESFPKSKWGIPEPTEEYLSSHPDISRSGTILDMIIVPGVAFDKNGGRIGHGRGYYGELMYIL